MSPRGATAAAGGKSGQPRSADARSLHGRVRVRLEHLWVHREDEGNNKLVFRRGRHRSMESPRNKTEMMKEGSGEEEVEKGGP